MTDKKEPAEVQKLTDEDLLSKKLQLTNLKKELEQLGLQEKQVKRDDKEGYFELYGQVVKANTYKKIREDIERVKHNIKALETQIKTKEVHM